MHICYGPPVGSVKNWPLLLANRVTDEDLRRRLSARRTVHAPHLIDAEVASAVRGLLLGGRTGLPRAVEILRTRTGYPGGVHDGRLGSPDQDTGRRARQGARVTFVRVLLIDDHRMLTDALAARLSAATDIWVVGSATTDDPRLRELIPALRPDVIITEVGPVAAETGRMLRTIGAARPGAHLVVLTASRDNAHAVAAARAGAVAWVPKVSSVEQLLGVVRAVCQGHAYYPPRQLGAVLRELRSDIRRARDHNERLEVLSQREREVLLRMIDGKPVSQIAVESLVSTTTVRTHVRNILAKLGVHSRLEAVRVARSAGLRPS
jgi:two-component system, NarL family, response regulator LiaR